MRLDLRQRMRSSRIQLDGLLAVDGEVGFVGDDVDDYGYFGVAGEDDGADGEQVGTDGREDHRVDRGHQDGAVGGERVGGGAGGGGDDDAVGAEAGYELAVHLDGELAHAGDGALGEDDVVEGVPLAEELVVAKEAGVHEAADVDDGGAGHPGLEGLVELGEGDFGEEAERAEVDGEDGSGGEGEGAGCGEKGAVAAERDDEHGLVDGQIGALDGLIAEAEVGGAVGLEDGGEAVAGEPVDEFGEDELQLRLLRLGDDSYLGHLEKSVPRGNVRMRWTCMAERAQCPAHLLSGQVELICTTL